MQPRRRKNDPETNVIITIDGVDIKPTQQLLILGLLLQRDGKAAAVIAKIKTACEQVIGMMRRVAT